MLKLPALLADARIPLSTLLGQPVWLDLQTSALRTDLRPFHGHVTAIAKLGAPMAASSATGSLLN
ncbi:hypothetical protein [Azonexus sp.]|jgi:type VI secretion system secreted protein VgrG|uniref:hypothetical protein n=1 Tax=Azonexus sp. TaxID=1872668 RepID=UPI002837AA87|nr:hypothetical protein [Azonexus sp.]MDR1995319.1 hypothetical protein [Azonexus sp.]